MKTKSKIISGLALSAFAASLAFIGCSDNKFEQETGTSDALKASPVEDATSCVTSFTDTVTLPQIIDEDILLSNTTLYLLNNKTYVIEEAEIEIEAGTRIEGVKKSDPDSASALVITRGCRIEAKGTASCPIVFTSHEASPATGDWGGLVILGKAPINQDEPSIEGINPPTVPSGVDYQFGGTNANDNSGILQYVRVEYAGAAISLDNELNAFTLGGVGAGTTFDHLEAYQGADDGFEFFGGTVSGKYLLSVSNNDDQFDFDFGYRGNLQFLVAIIDPSVVYASNNTNGIECDNDGDGSAATPLTRPVISNLTIAGPPNCTVSTANQVLNANRWRRNTRFVVRNSVFYNFPTGIKIESTGTINSIASDTCGSSTDSSYFFNNVVYACSDNYVNWTTDPTGQDVSSVNAMVLNTPENYNSFFSKEGLKPAGSPANSRATFCGLTPLNGSFSFDVVSYKGGAVDADGQYWLDDNWIVY